MTKIFAHRGLSSLYPENTMAAFKAAADQNIDGIELDVQLTKDHIPVVIHDATLDRTTNGRGLVRDHTYTEILELSAGNEGTVPSLDEVLKWSKGNSLTINIELKGAGLIEVVMEIVKRYDLEDRVILSSFDHQLISRVGLLYPEIETAIIVCSAVTKEYLQAIGTNGLHYCDQIFLKEEVLSFIKEGFSLRPYTINDRERLRELFSWGLSGIFTDFPHTATTIRLLG